MSTTTTTTTTGPGIVAGARLVAGLDRCESPECDRPARERFGTARLCRAHVLEAMATAYAMEGAL